jgi:hypothetical protein
MFSLKPWRFSIIVSLLSGGLLFFLSYGPPGRHKPAPMPQGATAGRFVALTLDASYPDRHIRELLAREGLATTIGESSQRVFLDDFGTLEQVPLDSYWDRVEPFDPRNDGYAALLQSFFVSGGERRIFIDLKRAPLDLEGRVKAALGERRYSLSTPEPRRSPLVPALLFMAAAALTLLLAREIHIMLFFLPLWAPLAGLGAAGFALTAVLAGLAGVLREPAREYFVSRRYGAAGGRLPSPGVWALSGLFLAAAALLAVFGRYPPLTVPAALILVPLVLCCALRTESCRGIREGHIRFKPVQIAPRSRRTGACSPILVPFALAAVALPLLSGVFPAAGGSAGGLFPPRAGWKSPPELSAERYREHAAFQQAFSYTSLRGGGLPYLRYSLAEDGLIDGAGSAQAVVAEPGEIPPFPLAPLIDFLADYAYTDPGPVAPRGESPAGAFIVPGLWVLLFLRDRRGRRLWGKLAMYMDKRIAA